MESTEMEKEITLHRGEPTGLVYLIQLSKPVPWTIQSFPGTKRNMCVCICSNTEAPKGHLLNNISKGAVLETTEWGGLMMDGACSVAKSYPTLMGYGFKSQLCWLPAYCDSGQLKQRSRSVFLFVKWGQQWGPFSFHCQKEIKWINK